MPSKKLTVIERPINHLYREDLQSLSESQNSVIKLPNSDTTLKFCLEKAGLVNIDGDIYFGLSETPHSMTQLIDGVKRCVCSIAPKDLETDHDYEAIKRWCIGTSLGFLQFGERFGLNIKRHANRRWVSDYVLANYLKFYGQWDPRDEYVRESSPRHHMPSFVVLSEIWNACPPYSAEMDRVVRSFWEKDFSSAIYVGGVKIPFSKRIATYRNIRAVRGLLSQSHE